MVSVCWLAFLVAACLASAVSGLATPNGIATNRKFTKAGERGAVVLIDVENVRGASGFELTHANVIDSSSIWAKAYGLGDLVSLIVDHGSAPNGFYLKEKELSIIFAGKQMKADDVIVRDVPFCQRQLFRDVIVVTGDTELIQRCKRAADRSGGKDLEVVKPIFFLQDLEKNVGDALTNCKDQEEQEKQDMPMSEAQPDQLTSEMETEITLGARLIAVETQLRSRGKSKKMSPKKRKKLNIQARKIRAKLGLSGPSSLDRVTSLIADGNALDSARQMELLAKWENIRKSSGRKEMTGDRVLLAESLRRQLESITLPNVAHSSDLDFESMNPAEAHASYANSLIFESSDERKDRSIEPLTIQREENLNAKDTLRIVVISDTHGCERSFTIDEFEPWLFTKDHGDNDTGLPKNVVIDRQDRRDRHLPDGDILLHLGDFAIDRGGVARRNALTRFDEWLSLQPHQVKIVVRGNHDPYQAEFPMSKARYVTKPTNITVGGKVIACVPYGHSGFSTSKARRSSSLIPSTCDILATHEPPYNILDKCLSGQKAGSTVIRTAVENMKGLPPKLWVCGHIHEGRGAIRTHFGTKHDTRETMIINASNANDGRASHLVHGPIVVDISDEGVVSDGEEKPAARARRPQSPKKREKQEGEQELLLAIDLGLRCGASLFDDTGKLLRYEQLRFSDGEELYQRAPQLIDSWTSEINSKIIIDAENPNKKYVLSYLAIEGGGELFDAWESSLDNDVRKDIQLVSVRPEEWRAHLLSQKERQSGRSCKEAARLIARQIVSDFGSMGEHEGKFKTDAAESVAMGFYMANHLGWISRKPLVSRYSNGKVIVPR